MANFNRTRLNSISNSSNGGFLNRNPALVQVTSCEGFISGTELTISSLNDGSLSLFGPLSSFIIVNSWDAGPDYSTLSVYDDGGDWIARQNPFTLTAGYAWGDSGPIFFKESEAPEFDSRTGFVLEKPLSPIVFTKIICLRNAFDHTAQGSSVSPQCIGLTTNNTISVFGTIEDTTPLYQLKDNFNTFTNIKDIAVNEIGVAVVKLNGSIELIANTDAAVDPHHIGPSFVPVVTNAVSIVGCNKSFLVLLSTGAVVSWGGLSSDPASVGLKTFRVFSSITKIITSSASYLESVIPTKTITSIYSGFKNFAAIDNTGALYVWGGNNLRKNGTDGIKYKSVSLAQGHAIALTQDNRVVTWGYNNDDCMVIPQPVIDAVAKGEEVGIYALDVQNSPDGLGGFEPRPSKSTISNPAGELSDIYSFMAPLPQGTPPVVDVMPFNGFGSLPGPPIQPSVAMWLHQNPAIMQSMSVYHLKTQGRLVFAGCKQSYFNNLYAERVKVNGRIEHAVPFLALSTAIPFDPGWSPPITVYDSKGNWVIQGILEDATTLDPVKGLLMGYFSFGVITFNSPIQTSNNMFFNQDLFVQKGIFPGAYLSYMDYNLEKNTEIKITSQLTGVSNEAGTYRVNAINGTELNFTEFGLTQEAASVLSTNEKAKTFSFRGNRNCLSPIGSLEQNRNIKVDSLDPPNTSILFNSGVINITAFIDSNSNNFISYVGNNRTETLLNSSLIKVFCPSLDKYATNVVVDSAQVLTFDCPSATTPGVREFILCTPYGYSSMGTLSYQASGVMEE